LKYWFLQKKSIIDRIGRNDNVICYFKKTLLYNKPSKNFNMKIVNRISRVAMISLIFVAAMTAIGLPTVKAIPPGMLYVDPSYQEIPVGTNFIVKFNLTALLSADGVSFNLTFDPSLLECIDATNDSFPPPDIKFSKTIDNTIGYVYVKIGAENEFSGSGTIADITFHCKGAGTSFLNFTIAYLNIFPINPTLQYNGTCNQVPPPVGGEVLAIDTLALLIPWIAVAGAVAVTAMALVLAGRRTYNH
jgi:hypothetical protein